MMLDIIAGGIFLSTAAYLGWAFWRRLPLLIQVPDQLIEQSFVTRPSRLRGYAMPMIEFFSQGKWRETLLEVAASALAWIRKTLVRMERATSSAIATVESRSSELDTEKYWSQLKEWKDVVKEKGADVPEEKTHDPELSPVEATVAITEIETPVKIETASVNPLTLAVEGDEVVKVVTTRKRQIRKRQTSKRKTKPTTLPV